MAYTVIMEKVAVVQQNGPVYNVTILTRINDGVKDIFTHQISKPYNKNATDLVALKTAILVELKEAWDKYKSEQAIFKAATFDMAIADMQAQAQTYINL